MIDLKKDELARWVAEIESAEKFRAEQLGTYRGGSNNESTTLAGCNIDYFEYGNGAASEEARSPLNLAFVLEKNIVPTLFPQNPKALALPTRKDSSASAPFAAQVINHFLPLLNFKDTMQQIIFDAWVVGMGVGKIGFTTENGIDSPLTDKQERKKLREKVKEQFDSMMVNMGLKNPKPEEEPEEDLANENEFIQRENPYVAWVDPFKFLIDPRARSIYEAWWCGESSRKTIWEIKSNERYSQARHRIKATPIETTGSDIPDTQLERFQTAEIYMLQYKNPQSPSGKTDLVIAQTSAQTEVLYHEHCEEPIRGWRYEVLTFNKHMHKLYPISDLSQVRPLLDRLNDSFAAILEQVDRFVTKIAYDTNKVTPEGKHALSDGGIGAEVACDGDPNAVFKVLNFEQLKQDVLVLVERIIDLIVLMTGLTRAQLTGLSTAQTATESQIGQAGSTNRRSDQSDAVIDFGTRVIQKLWGVIKFFVELEEIQLLTGETAYTDDTGLPNYAWLQDIDETLADQLRRGEYRFAIELSSVQRPNLEILRKQVENIAVVLTNQAIVNGLAAQGYMVDVKEGLKTWFKLFPDILADPNRIVRPISQQFMQSLQSQEAGAAQGGDRGGQAEAVRQAPPPNTADIASAAAGEKGQGYPLA